MATVEYTQQRRGCARRGTFSLNPEEPKSHRQKALNVSVKQPASRAFLERCDGQHDDKEGGLQQHNRRA